MKRLIIITALGLAIGLPSLTLAFVPTYLYTKLWIFSGPLLSLGLFLFLWSLYTKPVAKSEAKNEIKGGSIEEDFASFYTSSKLANTTASLTLGQKTDDQYSSVFGVQISLK